MNNATHTPGPWAWFGNPKHGGFYLATIHGGRKYVMDFVRHGLQGAQPRFQKSGIMEKASDICTFEVCDSTGIRDAEKNGHCYRYDIDGIGHPDARLIAAAPELLEALQMLYAATPDNEGGELGIACMKARQAIAKAMGKEDA